MEKTSGLCSPRYLFPTTVSIPFGNLFKNSKQFAASNALDEKMEKLVLKKIFERNKNTSIILIAHRLTSLNICDKLLILKDGFLETTTN